MIPFLNNLPDKVNALAENYLFFQLRSSRRNFLAFGATIIPRGITVKSWVDFKNISLLLKTLEEIANILVIMKRW